MKFFRFLKRLLKPVWSAIRECLTLLSAFAIFMFLSTSMGYAFHLIGLPILQGGPSIIGNYMVTGVMTFFGVAFLFLGYFMVLGVCVWIKKEWDKS